MKWLEIFSECHLWKIKMTEDWSYDNSSGINVLYKKNFHIRSLKHSQETIKISLSRGAAGNWEKLLDKYI